MGEHPVSGAVRTHTVFVDCLLSDMGEGHETPKQLQSNIKED